MKRPLLATIIIIALIGVAFYGQASLHLFSKPCSRPIMYSLGSFDTKFGISQEDFLSDVDKAIAIWEGPMNKDLFQYSPTGQLKINLVYDYRQEATDKLKSLGVSIDDTQASYESLKSRYNNMNLDYNKLKLSLDSQMAIYTKQKKAYEDQVTYWNDQGGAPKNMVTQLNAQRDSLNAQAKKINNNQSTLNELAVSINAMVDILNRMAQTLNLTASEYNKVGASRGDEFEEGAYISSGHSEQIDIYEFDKQDRLIRVLAHEFGHALGLQHIDTNPNAIMYRLNQGKSEIATPEDIGALVMLCGGQL